MDQQGQKQGNSQMPLDNLSYDLVTIIYEKSKALEAFDKYIKDAQNDNNIRSLLEELRQQDMQAVQKLKGELVRVMQQNS